MSDNRNSLIKPTLLILAAGLSSRYKLGLKQLDTFGPSGETLLDYAIYDAIKAGFGKAVFVIRKSIKEDFEKLVTAKYGKQIEYDFVFQELDDLPGGFKPSAQRQKPWGTGHAVWVARNMIKEPFAVINADDFYGTKAYKMMATFLTQTAGIDEKYAMIGFNLRNTLSDYGYVSRGICKVSDGHLIDIDERTNIRQVEGAPFYQNEQGAIHKLAPDAIVSMNFWGFLPDLFNRCENSFKEFLLKNLNNINSEFYLPELIKEQLKTKKTEIKVLNCSSEWMGVTYPEDKAVIKEKLSSFADAGLYPTPLF